MIESEDVRITRAGYDEYAELYARMVEGLMDDMLFDRMMLDAFAEAVRENGTGPVLEVGCGQGRVAAYLTAAGLRVSGIDLSPEMIRLARATYPEISFEIGSMEQLPLEDAALTGLVSWYSLIHTPPQRVPAVLTEFARVLRPGGHVIFGFQAADEPTGVTEYAHKVAPSFRWAPDTFAEVLAANGFRATAKLSREARPDERTPQATVLAVRV
ncbi:methyltransferase domain-containing protein [Nocardia sp. ET3-3]|uniref:Methyltransferase domain-containing protein n=1 Tax=Nocardia terrae TaxID=2675851 RepID=A0A7K1V0A2_9NOCA|nr:class I SAM-dependent methyltransferase [Nocardia terrae]MVU79977.1 methyltransferase domain-containing protein [Nocardia terrae]